MVNKWLAHVKKTMRHMKSKGTYKKGLGLSQVIKEAKKSWKHHKRGGADEEPSGSEEKKPIDVPDMPMEEGPGGEGGRRRRSHKRTRRHRRR